MLPAHSWPCRVSDLGPAGGELRTAAPAAVRPPNLDDILKGVRPFCRQAVGRRRLRGMALSGIGSSPEWCSHQHAVGFGTAQCCVRNSMLFPSQHWAASFARACCYQRNTGLLRVQEHAVAHDHLASMPQFRFGRLTVTQDLRAEPFSLGGGFIGEGPLTWPRTALQRDPDSKDLTVAPPPWPARSRWRKRGAKMARGW